MSNTTKKLTRAQLAEFLPDPRAIRAFEQILTQTTELLPSDIATLNRLIQETGFAADGAMAGVASALAQILDLAHQSAVNESTADSKATAALALAGQLARQLEAALVAPPPAPIGTAAYADLQTSATDATAGRVLKVGAFGLGGSVSLGLFDLNTAQVGSFIGVNGTEADAATYNWPVTGVVGTTPVWYSVLTYGTTSRTTQRATWIFSGEFQGRIWERVKHDTTWSSWREVPRFDTSSGLSVPGLLAASGGLSVGGATTIPCQGLGLYDLNNAGLGSHVAAYGTEADAATYNWPATGAASATAVYWVVRTHGVSGRVIQRAVQVFNNGQQGRIFERVKHDTTWSSWRECPRLDTSAGLAIGGILTATGGLKTGLASALVTSTVAMNNGAAAATATLTNAPVAGNPTKWIPINDNGTTRYIPAW